MTPNKSSSPPVDSGIASATAITMNAEEKARKKAYERQRWATFLRAMKRLGYEDSNTLPCPWSCNLTDERVLNEILKDDNIKDEDEEKPWTIYEVEEKMSKFRHRSSTCEVWPEFKASVKAAIDKLGGGDMFHESVTPRAVFEMINLPFVAFHDVWYFLGRNREMELLRRRWTPSSRNRPPRRDRKIRLLLRKKMRTTSESDGESISCGDETSDDGMYESDAEESDEEEKETEFMRELRTRSEEEEKSANRFEGTFYKAVMQLGGLDNLWNMTPETLHKLITEELDPVDEDGCWTSTKSVERMLNYWRCGVYIHPEFTWEHRNRMLKAVEVLGGGNVFDENRVNPETVLTFMDDIEGIMTLQVVEESLEYLRNKVKKNPSHRVTRLLRKPTMPRLVLSIHSEMKMQVDMEMEQRFPNKADVY